MGFLMSALVSGWGLYVWVRECSSLDAEAIKYDHKSSFRNSISMWLHVEKSPCQMFVAQDLEY